MFNRLLVTAMIAAIPATATADFYKCTAADGKITYSDKRCITTTDVVHSPSAARGSGFIIPQSGRVADDPAGAEQLQALSRTPRTKLPPKPETLR